MIRFNILPKPDGNHVPSHVSSIAQINQVRFNTIVFRTQDKSIEYETHIIEFLIPFTRLLNSQARVKMRQDMTFSGDVFCGWSEGEIIGITVYDACEARKQNLRLHRQEAISLYLTLITYLKSIVTSAGSSLDSLEDWKLIEFDRTEND